MNYLFFDIECSDGYHICSFGYVLVDKNMNIVKKEDIVINPESKFILSSSKKRPKIELAYSKEYFYKQGNFETQYEKIKKILKRENQIIFGHSIASDFHFLLYACKRYSLDILNLVGYDTQKIYQIALGKKNVESLEKIINECEIKKKLQYHKSSEDAHATFLVAQTLCKKFDVSLKGLAEKFSSCRVDSKEFLLKPIKERFVDKVEKIRNEYKTDNVKGRIAFSEIFKVFDREEQLKIIEAIYKSGYEFCEKISECDIYVKNESIKLKRDLVCLGLIESGKRIEMISLSKCLKMINFEIKK